MSESFPIVQEELSDTQREFMDLVETYIIPPPVRGASYSVSYIYPVSHGELPGNGIKFRLAVDETEEDVSIRRHRVELVNIKEGQQDHEVLAHVGHQIKRVETGQGVGFWTESKYTIGGLGGEKGQVSQEEIERDVQNAMRIIKNSPLPRLA
jgi:hypothetical protein